VGTGANVEGKKLGEELPEGERWRADELRESLGREGC